MNVENILTSVKEQLLGLLKVIPNLVGALVLLIVGWIIAKIISKFVKKVLSKTGIDRAAEKLNNIDFFQSANIRIVPSVIVEKILYYLLLFIFIVASVEALGMKVVSDLLSDMFNYIPNILSAFIVFFMGVWAADMLKKATVTTAESLGIPIAKLLGNIVFYFLLLNIAMITLSQAKINTKFIQDNLSIILGGLVLAFAIGYGFASRPIVANFLASFYNKGKVKAGDIIRIDGVKGEVIEMSNSSVTIQGEEGKIIIPLSKFNSETFEIIDKK